MPGRQDTPCFRGRANNVHRVTTCNAYAGAPDLRCAGSPSILNASTVLSCSPLHTVLAVPPCARSRR
jgi:hypothetical protein